MSEKFNEKANALAGEYWRLKRITKARASVSRLEEIEKLLEKGIGGKLREKLEAEQKRLRKEKEDRDNAFIRLEEVKRGLLELSAELAPNLDLPRDGFFPYDSDHEPISENYFSALTDIFFSAPSPHIEFKIATFSRDGIRVNSSDDDSPLNALSYIITIIQETAKHMLGMDNAMDKSCELLRQNEYAPIVLGTLVKAGKRLEMDEIKEISHREDKEYKELVSDTYDKELVNGIEYLVSDRWAYSLVKEYDDGRYEATDFGEWVWRICGVRNEEGRGKRRRRRDISNPHIHKIINLLKR